MFSNFDTQADALRIERSLILARAERRALLIESAAASRASRGPRWHRVGRRWRGVRGRVSAQPAQPALMLLALLVGSVSGESATVFAQDATPSGVSPSELSITITDSGFDLSAETVPAGQVRLTVENQAPNAGDTADADLLLPPAGTSVETVLAEIATINAAVLGTPIADTSSLETASGLPDWVYQATWAGGPLVPPGETVASTVTLAAGTWILFNGSFGSLQQPTTIEVTGSAASAEAPRADVEVAFADFAFGGLADGLTAGEQTWKITNFGEQPHLMVILKVPAGTTADELLQIVENGPSPDGPYAEEDFEFSQPGLGLLSGGQTAYLTLDLAAGTYAAICYVPDVETGMMHAMMGMIQVFEVAGATSQASKSFRVFRVIAERPRKPWGSACGGPRAAQRDPAPGERRCRR